MITVKNTTLADYKMIVQTGILIRETEQSLLNLFSQGKLYGTVHTCIGQEFTGIAVARAFQKGDFIFSNHRGHGHYLAWTNDVEGLISEIMGRETGVCGGRGGSQHLCKDGFYSNGIQGGTVPVATGMALAEKLKNTNAIGAVFLGDGTLGEGAVYESLNIASKHQLPLLLIIENNLYSQSTSQQETLAGTINGRVEAFGINYSHTSTWNLDELMQTVDDASKRIRNGFGPEVCIVDTYRLMAHSKGDDDRNLDEIERYRAQDILSLLYASEEDWVSKSIVNARERVQKAINQSDNAPYPSSLKERAPDNQAIIWNAWQDKSNNKRIAERIRYSFKETMQKNSTIIHIGEDIRSPYGGAFKATKGLSDLHPDHVLNMPISEQAIVGIGNGLALRGMRPFTEIMFGDFMSLTFDQIINHAAKFSYMFNEKVSVPLVIRTPMGGKRGYGPTHSQSLEKHFLGIPNVQVLSIHHRSFIEKIYEKLALTQSPTLLFEYKVLYSRKAAPPLKGFHIEESNCHYPFLKIGPTNIKADVTIVAYGEMAEEAEKALEILFDEHEVLCEMITPTQLHPLNTKPFINSVTNTKHLVVVEEGQIFCGFGSELISQMHEQLSGLNWKSKRIGPATVPIPASRPLESLALPDCHDIVQVVLEVFTNENH